LFRLAVIRFAMRPEQSSGAREPLMHIPQWELTEERAALERCMRRYNEQRAVDVDTFRPEEEVVPTAVLPPSPPRATAGEELDLATAKTEDDDDEQEHIKRAREASGEPPQSMYI
jgi:hypothetical protein